MDFHFHLIVTWLLSQTLGFDFWPMVAAQLVVDIMGMKWLGQVRLIGRSLHIIWPWLLVLFFRWDLGLVMVVHILMDALSHGETQQYFYPFKSRGIGFLQKLSIFYWFGDPSYREGVRRRGRRD
jgi:hypothetical protein